MIKIMSSAMAFPKRPSSRSIFIISSARARNAFFSTVSASSPLSQNACRRLQQQQRHFYFPRCATLVNKTTLNLSLRALSSSSSATNNEASNTKIRIAVVGGGAAGMTAALHLSPLVAAGLVQGPVDVYESTITKKSKESKKCRNSGHTNHGNTGGKQLYPGSGALGRDIGVGIWSTAWWPFLRSVKEGLSNSADDDEGGDNRNTLADMIQQQKNRQSYQTLLQDLEACGSYVKDVGYRTPNGSWLVKSELNASPFGIQDLLDDNINSKSIDDDDPALLFVREKDLLSCLRNAIKIEQRLGTVKYHSGVRVDGIENVNGDLGSLVLQSTTNASDGDEKGSSISPQYHLIIAADGLHSPLRSRFAGHNSSHVTGTGMESSSSRKAPKDTLEYKWEHTKGQREATQVEDREYIVFRGNAPKLESSQEDGSGSFQTWGEERSMRFAAVPFRHETEDLDDDDDDSNSNSGHYSKSQSFISKKQMDEEVWFATISDPAFIDTVKASTGALNAIEQKKLLLEAFGPWHKPIKTLIETTPADKIMFDLAVAHRHNARPVFDVGRIMEFELWQQKRKAKENGSQSHNGDGKIYGRGPILSFIGDSYMTVDPVLAQGFTMAMESGATIVQSVEQILVHPGATSSTPIYQPKLLRDKLLQRHYSRERRLLQLLRSTELVQRLAQPHGFGAILATWIIRPVVKLCPEGVKKRVFDYMIRYSLGLTGDRDSGGKQ